MLVIRAEDGMLGDMEGIFRDVFRDHIRPEGALPQGSVILVGSVSHLSLLGLSAYVEDLVRCCNLLISLAGPGITICPLVPVPLSGISEIRTIVDLANFDSWLSSSKIAANIHLPSSRNIFWESLCSSSSSFVDMGPPGEIHYIPVSLTNSHKRRFAAGALKGQLLVTVPQLDSGTETEIVTALCTELNTSYCLSLPSTPVLDRGSESHVINLDGKRVVVVGASHAGKLSALLAASLETKFLKLPQQSQTPDAAEDLADELRSMELTGNDVVYLDLLSNQVYLGTDEDGNSSEPFKDNHKKWHISGSLVAAAKPRIRKVLDRLSAVPQR